MKRMLVMFLAVSLVMVPYATLVSAKTSRSDRPPIEQPLVREGDFAIQLASSLSLTKSNDEAAAEDVLASISIAPRNGWISDYPMTPDIIAEVRESTARAAVSGSLSMAETEATGIVDRVGIDMKLPVTVAGSVAGEGYSYDASGSSSSSYSSSSSSTVESGYAEAPPPDVGLYDEAPGYVEEYYGDNGPPVVTYYPPPWSYYWLYDWVPWPFWWGGFGFGGFFVLGDFDVHHHGHHFSNHFRNANGRFGRVDPASRANRTAGTANSSRVAGANRTGSGSRLNSANARAGATALMNRSTGTAAGGRAGNTANASRLSGTQSGRNLSTGSTGRTMQGANRLATYTNRAGTSSSPRNSMSSSSPRSGGSSRTGGSFRTGSSSLGGRSFGSASSSRGFSGGGVRGGGYSGGGFHGGGGHGGGGGFGGGGHGGGGGGHR